MGTEHVHARVLDFSPFALRKKPRARYAGYFCIKYVSFSEKFCEFFKKKTKLLTCPGLGVPSTLSTQYSCAISLSP